LLQFALVVMGPCARAQLRTRQGRRGDGFRIRLSNSERVCVRVLAASSARALRNFRPPQEQRAQGKPGARCTRDLVCNLRIGTRTRAYRSSGGIPAFPARWVTAYFVLFPVNGSFATVAPEKLASQELDASTAASEPHDFAVRVMPASSVMASASTASHRTFVTIASRPSCRVGWHMDELICMRTKGEYFCAGYWTKRWRDLPDVQHRHW